VVQHPDGVDPAGECDGFDRSIDIFRRCLIDDISISVYRPENDVVAGGTMFFVSEAYFLVGRIRQFHFRCVTRERKRVAEATVRIYLKRGAAGVNDFEAKRCGERRAVLPGTQTSKILCITNCSLRLTCGFFVRGLDLRLYPPRW